MAWRLPAHTKRATFMAGTYPLMQHFPSQRTLAMTEFWPQKLRAAIGSVGGTAVLVPCLALLLADDGPNTLVGIMSPPTVASRYSIYGTTEPAPRPLAPLAALMPLPAEEHFEPPVTASGHPAERTDRVAQRRLEQSAAAPEQPLPRTRSSLGPTRERERRAENVDSSPSLARRASVRERAWRAVEKDRFEQKLIGRYNTFHHYLPTATIEYI